MTMNRIETALFRFAVGFNCSQSVLSAYAEHFGFDEETAMKISSGFGGGMGRMADTCGAVTGAYMVLGLKYGQNSPDQEAKEGIYAWIKDFAVHSPAGTCSIATSARRKGYSRHARPRCSPRHARSSCGMRARFWKKC